MKRDKYYDIAETMYVEQFITEVGIAKRLGISDRTVRRWKAEVDWGEKRKEFINKQTLTNYDIYQLVRQMLNKDFLYYLLSSNYIFQQFCGKVSGAVVKNLNTNKVAEAIVCIPPLAEQQRIVDKVEELMKMILELTN